MCRADLGNMRDWYATCIFWATLAVVVGCVMEVPEVLHELWPDLFAQKFDRLIKIVSSIGLLFVVLGVAGELSFEHWRSGYEELLQRFDNVLLADAELHAASAEQEAGDAKESALKAADASVLASGAASNAVSIASTARKEADSFEATIVSAKNQAADAESHLADALKQVTEAQAALLRIKSPRVLTRIPELEAELAAYKGTEYTFSSVFQDEESINLLKSVDAMLQAAGWKRVKAPKGFPAIDIYGKDADLVVTSSLINGVKVHVESPIALKGLQATAVDKLPAQVRAGIALDNGLINCVSPPPDALMTSLDVEPGTTTTVFIDIGKKF